MRTVIKIPLDLSAEEAAFLDNHSFLNIFNILEQELQVLTRRTKDPELRAYANFCVELLLGLSESDLSLQVADYENRFSELASLLKKLLARYPGEESRLETLLEILEVAKCRLGEFDGDRFQWRWIPCSAFKDALVQFLMATEKVGRRRFCFVFDQGSPPENGYRICLDMEGKDEHFFAPRVLQDTLRDLVANARKYSNPGSTIRVLIRQVNDGELLLRVEDEGIGIPEDEIQNVILYGYRASNVAERRTMGGGIGLTKAYQLCRRFDGEFSIDSSTDSGTVVEMNLKVPT